MRKNVKAIIAALSASIMCAVPVAASFASTAATTSITAEAASDIIYDAQHAGVVKPSQVICYSLVYDLNESNKTASLNGRYNPVRDITLPDQLRVNGVLYKITSVKNDAFKTTNVSQYTVNNFKGGKYLETIGARAFQGTVVRKVEVTSKKITIGDDAFRNTSVGTVILPGRATIGDRAFKDNRWLEKVQFVYNDSTNYNSSVSLGSNAFENDPALTNFNSQNRRVLNLHRNTFANTNNVYFSGFSLYYVD
jgi:Cu/Ag efflux protein CusF